MDHTGIVYSVRSSSSRPYMSKEAYETVKQQWMSLLAAYPDISCVERVPEI